MVLGTMSCVLSDQTAVLEKFFKKMGVYREFSVN